MKKMTSAILTLAISASLFTATVSAESVMMKEEMPSYTGFTGKILGTTQGDVYMAKVQSKDGTRMDFVINPETYVFDNVGLKMDEQATFFYQMKMGDMTKPAADMDAKFDAVAIAKPEKNTTVFVGEFMSMNKDKPEETLISKDQKLVIQGLSTVMKMDSDGKPYTGTLVDKKLAVVYSIETKSLPPKTTPSKVIVLKEASDMMQFPMPIIVNGEAIDAPPSYMNDGGKLMVPLNAIASALKVEVKWDNVSKSIRYGNMVTFQVGKNAYNYGKMGAQILTAAPEIKDGRTYVPLDFFQFTQTSEAYATEGNININNK